MDDAQLAEFIDASAGRLSVKKTFKDRLANPEAAFEAAAGKPAIWLARISAGEDVHPSTAKEAGEIGRALQGIGGQMPAPADALRNLAGECLDAVAGIAKATYGSYIRRGIARLDEVFDRLPVE